MTTAALTGLLIFGAAVWIGGFTAIAVVARSASSTLEPAARVALFRRLGRAYGLVGTCALALAYGTGAALVYGRPWSATLTATAAVATALVAATAIGVVQARRMSRLRRHALDLHDDAPLGARVRRGALRAALLRGAIGGLSLALLALGVLLGS
jgi:uncharacterized membrane protein